MIRQLAAILLLFAFTAQTFKQTAIVLDYYTNTASYAKNCENKAKPILRCAGKCQMMKKLEEETKKEEQTDQKQSLKNEIVSSKSFFTSITSFRSIFLNSYSSYYLTRLPDKIAPAVFHPPSIV